MSLASLLDFRISQSLLPVMECVRQTDHMGVLLMTNVAHLVRSLFSPIFSAGQCSAMICTTHLLFSACSWGIILVLKVFKGTMACNAAAFCCIQIVYNQCKWGLCVCLDIVMP